MSPGRLRVGLPRASWDCTGLGIRESVPTEEKWHKKSRQGMCGAVTVKCQPWALLVTGTVLGSDANPYLTALTDNLYTQFCMGTMKTIRREKG